MVPPKFSDELQALVERFHATPASLADILKATQGRGYSIVLVLITVPFTGPVPLPGLSLPFGLAAALLGLRQLLNRGPWLPRRVLDRRISPRVLATIFGATGKVMKVIEIAVRPRFGFVFRHEIFSRMAGLLILIAGVMLMLPVPLPFSNALPAWSIVLLSIGTFGRDGLFYVAGCGAFLISLAYFTALALGGVKAIDAAQLHFMR